MAAHTNHKSDNVYVTDLMYVVVTGGQQGLNMA